MAACATLRINMKRRSELVSNRGCRRLTETIKGRVVLPGHHAYDDARASWNQIDQKPAVIIQCGAIGDVPAALRLAQTEGLAVAVNSTGHGAVLPCDGGLLIDTFSLVHMTVNSDAGTATIEPGVRWMQFMETAHRAGVAGPSGFASDVGVVGFTLGGGMGWLSRTYGLAADNVVDAEVVLADGTVVLASEPQHADLLWAICGGGGNFGIVTSLTLRCAPVTEVYGGALHYAYADAPSLLRRFADWTRDIPETMTGAFTIAKNPPDPMIPKQIRGKTTATVGVCFLGSESGGAALTRTWRADAVLLGQLKMLPTSELGMIEPGPPKGMVAYKACAEFMTLDGITEMLVDAFADRSPVSQIEIRHLGGAVSRAGADALGHRDAQYVVVVESVLHAPNDEGAAREYTSRLLERLRPHATGGATLSFLPEGAEGVSQVPRAFTPEQYARLRAVKTKYDPSNIFRLNYNIPPL